MRFFYSGSVFLILFLLFAGSCKKKQAFDEESAQDAIDIRFTQGECDAIIRDINIVITEQFLLRGKNSEGMGSVEGSTTTVCGVHLDTTLITKGTATLKYDGSACGGRGRSGNVKFSILNYPLKKWKHPGCSLKVECAAYKVTNLATGATINMSGSFYLINESGNTWYELWYLNEPKVTYRMSGYDMKVIFNGGDDAKFNFERFLTFTYQNKVTACLVEGNTSENNTSSTENWGLSRRNEHFASQVTTPYVWKTSCGPAAPLSGMVDIKIDEKPHQLKCIFGVSSFGDEQNGIDNPCPYGWKTTWNYKKKTNSRIFSYF